MACSPRPCRAFIVSIFFPATDMFSKTSIIGWQKTLKGKKVYLILGFWLISILLYYIDFKLGFIVLFFLSFLHVLLEFPLNIVTIKELISNKKGVK